MAITSMTIRGLVDTEGDTRVINVSADTLCYNLELAPVAVARMLPNEFFFTALDYLEAYTDIVNTDDAKIDEIYS